MAKAKRGLYLNLLAVAITSLIVCASLFRIFGISMYLVGSSSMEPALLGDPDDGDRVLCLNYTYLLREPKRWEIAIFRTPESSRERSTIPNFTEGSEVGTTIKRIVGLPGERLALAKGDVWTRPLGREDAFVLQVKPDSVQQGMWIGVYDETFDDVNTEEFLFHWTQSGDGTVEVGADHALRLMPTSPGGAPLGLTYRAMARSGVDGKGMRALRGVPDRYVLDQIAHFSCQGRDGCGSTFTKRIFNQMIQAHCPSCGRFLVENSVMLYERRSGLPEIGPYAVSSVQVLQGGEHIRMNNYHFVPDLRIMAEMQPLDADSLMTLAVFADDETTSLRVGPGELTVNGVAPAGGRPAVAPGEWLPVELYMVEGVARCYIGKERKLVVEAAVRNDPKPELDELVKKSGVFLAAEGGGVAVRHLRIDRDIFYYSGREHTYGYHHSAMDAKGAADVPAGHFFPLGDNCTVSLDARNWGPVSEALLRGTAWRIWAPEERAGPIPAP